MGFGPVTTRPMISIAATAGLLKAITAADGNPDQILHKLGIERAAFSNPDGFIPSSIFAGVLEEAARVTADDCFGLHLGERFNPKNVGPLMYVALNSPTIGAGLENVGRYQRVLNEAAKWFFTVEGDRGYIRFRLTDLGIAAPRQHHECSMAVALNTFRIMVGSQWVPQEVQFAHEAPAQISEHLRIFSSPVLFGYETNAFVVEPEFIERQVPAADPRLYRILKQYLEGVLSAMPREDGLLASVRRTIAELMRDGDPKLARVAKKMAMGPRTLQRRLKEYGFDFKKLVEDTRQRFAVSYLKDRKNSLTEVAFLLGYSELSAFNRAFKRWTRSTPLDYQRKMLRQA
jgi:AraC-like DNA-binding protein